VNWYQKKQSSTHTSPNHQPSLICVLHLQRSVDPPSSIYVLDSLFPQTLSMFSLVYLLAWHPPLHIPYISSPNHCLLFATHAHIIATCFAVVPKLCHLILVPLSHLLGTLSCSLMPHIHLTILISVKCHHIFLSYGPGLTSMQQITSHTLMNTTLNITKCT